MFCFSVYYTMWLPYMVHSFFDVFEISNYADGPYLLSENLNVTFNNETEIASIGFHRRNVTSFFFYNNDPLMSFQIIFFMQLVMVSTIIYLIKACKGKKFKKDALVVK